MLTECTFLRGVLVQECHKAFMWLRQSSNLKKKIFLLQASISGVKELCVRFTFTAMLCSKVILSPACFKAEH